MVQTALFLCSVFKNLDLHGASTCVDFDLAADAFGDLNRLFHYRTQCTVFEIA